MALEYLQAGRLCTIFSSSLSKEILAHVQMELQFLPVLLCHCWAPRAEPGPCSRPSLMDMDEVLSLFCPGLAAPAPSKSSLQVPAVSSPGQDTAAQLCLRAEQRGRIAPCPAGNALTPARIPLAFPAGSGTARWTPGHAGPAPPGVCQRSGLFLPKCRTLNCTVLNFSRFCSAPLCLSKSL